MNFVMNLRIILQFPKTYLVVHNFTWVIKLYCNICYNGKTHLPMYNSICSMLSTGVSQNSLSIMESRVCIGWKFLQLAANQTNMPCSYHHWHSSTKNGVQSNGHILDSQGWITVWWSNLDMSYSVVTDWDLSSSWMNVTFQSFMGISSVALRTLMKFK